MPTRIALSKGLLELRGAQIYQVAPAQIELVAIDERGDVSWREAEIFIHSEFANDQTPDYFVSNMPRLRWLHTIYAGTDDLPWQLISARNLIVTNSAGVYAPMMAEYVIAMLVVHYRKLHEHFFAQREHRQLPSRVPPEWNGELFGKRMGILGYGAVGRRLAHIANAFGMRVWALRRTPMIAANEPVEQILDAGELDLLLRECDVVVITAALNTSTRHLIGARELQMLQRDAVLVNIARGAILDEQALVRALEEGWFGGAILDVTATEPLPANSPLWDAPNLLLTPHISGEMPIGRERSIHLFCQNLKLYLEGRTEFFGNRVGGAQDRIFGHG